MSIPSTRNALHAALRSSRVSVASSGRTGRGSIVALSDKQQLLQCVKKSRSSVHQGQLRMFSEEATKASEEPKAGQPPKELTFSTPRVKELYEKMTKLKEEEVSIVGQLILDNLGLKIEPDEFYYHGIGKSGGGGKAAAGAADGEEVVEVAAKKDSFDVKLAAFDEKSKIKVIKEVRAITGLGLKEAKELVEGAPKVIQKDLKEEPANELKKKLEEVGATIELI